MLVLDRYKSHESVEFQEYCKSYNIITLGLPPYSSYLTQPLDVRYFSPLKRIYGRQIEGFIKAYINYITKVEFLIVTTQESICTTVEACGSAYESDDNRYSKPIGLDTENTKSMPFEGGQRPSIYTGPNPYRFLAETPATPTSGYIR
jgi:hypothetical protein